VVIVKGSPMLADDINFLTFFPKGTILSISGTNYSALVNSGYWVLCNQEATVNGVAVPNLTDKFLRGGTSSGAKYSNPTTGNTQAISVPLPLHSHKHKHDNHTGQAAMMVHETQSYSGALSTIHNLNESSDGNAGSTRGTQGTLYINASHNEDATTAGTANASITVNTMPSYYTVVYIIKVK